MYDASEFIRSYYFVLSALLQSNKNVVINKRRKVGGKR